MYVCILIRCISRYLSTDLLPAQKRQIARDIRQGEAPAITSRERPLVEENSNTQYYPPYPAISVTDLSPAQKRKIAHDISQGWAPTITSRQRPLIRRRRGVLHGTRSREAQDCVLPP